MSFVRKCDGVRKVLNLEIAQREIISLFRRLKSVKRANTCLAWFLNSDLSGLTYTTQSINHSRYIFPDGFGKISSLTAHFWFVHMQRLWYLVLFSGYYFPAVCTSHTKILLVNVKLRPACGLKNNMNTASKRLEGHKVFYGLLIIKCFFAHVCWIKASILIAKFKANQELYNLWDLHEGFHSPSFSHSFAFYVPLALFWKKVSLIF